jgi:hypothetical protein
METVSLQYVSIYIEVSATVQKRYVVYITLVSLWICVRIHVTNYNRPIDLLFKFSWRESIIVTKINEDYFKASFFSFSLMLVLFLKATILFYPERTHKMRVWRQAIVFCLCDLVTRSKLRHHTRAVQMISFVLIHDFSRSFLRTDEFPERCACVCVCVCVCVYARARVCVCKCMYVMYVGPCMYMCMRVCIDSQ